VDYDTERPHASLDGLTPRTFAARLANGQTKSRFHL
jgi:hypothetical protein